MLEWVFKRCDGEGEAIETPIGNLPTLDGINFDGLNLSEQQKAQLLRVEVDGWLSEIPLIEEYFDQYGDRVPAELREEVAQLKSRLEAAKQAVA